jgi:hypothetical protein
VSQEIVAEMVSIRLRVNIFIGRFKKFGLIEENDGVLELRPALARVADGATELSQTEHRGAGSEGIVHEEVRQHKRKVHREIHHCGNGSVDHGAHAFAGRGQ